MRIRAYRGLLARRRPAGLSLYRRHGAAAWGKVRMNRKPQRKPRGVLFDLDGTLIDTYDLILQSFRYTVRTVLGRDVPDALLMAKVGQPLATQMWDFADSAAVHEELCRVYREYNAQIHDAAIREFPGTMEALAQLAAAGHPLGVVTSKRHACACQGLARFGMEPCFEFVIGSDDWPAHKPDPGPVSHGCDLLGLPPGECLYVGDSPFDLQAGNAAGCLTAAALWGMFPEGVLAAEHPDFLCASLADVPALLAAW